ncbi:MAG: hypothetical protein ACLGHN_03145 [Bacteriovoracia bacterium]
MEHQKTLENKSTSSSASSTPEVAPSTETISSSTKKCEENDQTSIPLKAFTSLIQEENGQLEILHDPRTGSLSVSSGDMIGNCSSMLEWKMKQPIIQGKKAYALEVKIKEGENCTDAGCTYKVAKVENGEFKKHEETILKPTLKGFEECLQKSGVIVNGKVVKSAIYNLPVNEKFNGFDQSGQLLFLSHGPTSPLVKAKYGKFEHVDACDYYEAAHPEIRNLLTLSDAEKARLDAEAAKLRECTVNEYGKLADFIEKYEGYADELGEVRDRLILEAAQKAAKAIEEGKYTDEDLKVISDFHRYVVQPKVDYAVNLYEEMLDLEGDAKKAAQERLKAVLAQISTYNKKPYFLSSHTLKLIQDGKFENAEKLNDMKLVIEHHQRLGAKQDNVVITPAVAAQRVAAGKSSFADTVVKETERYEIRTGQVTGKSKHFNNLAKRMRNNIEVRTQNFNEEIQLEIQRVRQPNGYCYKYWRNTQKCIQDSMQRIQELQALLQHYNKVDEERAAEYDAQAQEYGELEAQGRRYIAAQNGEPVPETTTVAEPVVEDTTRPNPRPQVQDPGVYSFNFNQGQPNPQMYQQQAQMMPQMYQQPMNPYQNNNMFMQQSPYGYQSPYMGQQSMYGGNYGYQSQGSYNFNWGGGMQQPNMYGGYQQNMYGQQPQGYWNNPYQAYNHYSIYGRTW